MIKLNKHGLISKRLIAPEFTVGNTFVEGGGTPEELSVLSLTKDQLDALSYIVNGEGRIIPVGEDGTFDTKIGHSYCIRHTDDLTLHEAWLSNDENLYVKRYGSGQLLFFATSEKCKINDPSYIVTEVFRMAALNDFVDWSGIEHYQKWFKEIEVELTELLGSRDKFVLDIAEGNTLVVHTDRISDDLLPVVKATAEAIMPEGTTVVQYNHNIEISWRDINKYAACTNVDDVEAVNPDYKNDLTSEGEWVYPLSSLTNSTNVLSNNASLKKANLYMPSVRGWAAQGTLYNCKNLTEAHIFAPNIAGIEGMFSSCPKLKKVSGEVKSVIVGHNAFLNSPIEILEIEFSKLDRAERFAASTNGNTSATAPRLNKESALRVLNSIPSFTSGNHPIVLGIHVDHQNDEDVLAAIDNAEAKGWTLTVQWNGTPTSTASTMAMGQLVYAKVGELESPDGTTKKYLDWGHYVTNPEGYETFRSLESAYEYFGLEMPEIE
jgi:hypothetical protein